MQDRRSGPKSLLYCIGDDVVLMFESSCCDTLSNGMTGVVVGTAVSPEGDGSSESLWLPTCCLQLLQRICKARPNHLLIAADFDELPDVALPGQGAPLVASMVCPTSAQHFSNI